MMPNEGRRRGAALRVGVLALAGLAIVLAGAFAWGPLTAGISGPAVSTAPAAAATIAASPAGSPAPASSAPGSPSPSPSPSPTPTLAPTPTPVPSAQLQATLDRYRRRMSVPGVSVAILWDSGQTWLGASGLRNVATNAAMTTDTTFPLASVSKTFTAAVVLELVQEGRLALDQRVAPLLPSFNLDSRITVRMLLDHTSGLADFFMGKGIDAALQRAPDATWTAQQAWAYLPARIGKPGKVWYYSNSNYMLLGQLVSAVTGHPLAQEIRTRLLGPLGLAHAWYQAVEPPIGPGTTDYILTAKQGGGWNIRPVPGPSGVMPFRSVVTAAGGAGSMAATALDAARWMRAWAGGDVLGATMQAAVLADVSRTEALGAGTPYGLGIQDVTVNGLEALGHSGRYLGVRNVVRYIPSAGITIAVLTNQSVWDPTRIASALLSVVLPSPSPSASASPGASGTGSASPGASATAPTSPAASAPAASAAPSPS